MGQMPIELQAARLKLVKSHPYVSSAVWAMEPILKPGIATMGVDKYWRLYYDPEVASKWSVDEISTVLYHEIQHLLRDHAKRMEGKIPEVANYAADLEINDDIISEGMGFPENPLLPELFGFKKGLFAEEYYDLLVKETLAKDQQPQSNQSNQNNKNKQTKNVNKNGKDSSSKNSQAGNGDNMNGNGEGDSNGNGQASGGSNENGQAEGKDNIPHPGAGSCGSCANGEMAPWEDAPPISGKDSGVSEAEAELIRRDIAQKILQSSKTRGDVPGYMVRWADAKLKPRIDWRKELAASVRTASAKIKGCADYSYSRPGRRQSACNKVIMPALISHVPDIAVVVDTSGSIDDDMLSQALSEIKGILRSCGNIGINVLSVDSCVYTCKRVFSVNQVHLVGGGGTDMDAGIEAALKLKPRPQIIVVLTDGYTPWPYKPPTNTKVIIGMMSDLEGPEWAKTIYLRQ